MLSEPIVSPHCWAFHCIKGIIHSFTNERLKLELNSLSYCTIIQEIKRKEFNSKYTRVIFLFPRFSATVFGTHAVYIKLCPWRIHLQLKSLALDFNGECSNTIRKDFPSSGICLKLGMVLPWDHCPKTFFQSFRTRS